ncbi:MAG: shikimate dehydrogenase [Anaerolineae bacterium]|nr:shikimate dehydrogenase [Anaerolineae bacterium]MDW8099873.1 shikimate dehydrogenase [Anaerolineae bacterium]
MGEMGIDGRTRLVGVIGWPVEHSLSPQMHNAAFDALGMNWRYLPLPVAPDQIGAALAGLRALGFVGVNVTIPHKQAVIPYLHDLTEAARAIGAVNTIWVEKDGQLHGDNTDAYGFLAALREGGFEPQGARVAILGAGGSARAVTYALAMAGASRVGLWNRTLDRAEAIARDMSALFPQVAFEAHRLPGGLGFIGGDVNLIVNCTPVGMWPQVDTSPWPADLPLPSRCFVMDLIYQPLETRFLAQARAAGARTLNGLGMLIHQGAAAFRRWTGVEPPLEVMARALQIALQA